MRSILAYRTQWTRKRKLLPQKLWFNRQRMCSKNCALLSDLQIYSAHQNNCHRVLALSLHFLRSPMNNIKPPKTYAKLTNLTLVGIRDRFGWNGSTYFLTAISICYIKPDLIIMWLKLHLTGDDRPDFSDDILR